jgi:serralysin
MQTIWRNFEVQSLDVSVGTSDLVSIFDDGNLGSSRGGALSGLNVSQIGKIGDPFGLAGGPDIAGNASTTAVLAVGGNATSDIDVVDDTDWFKITLTSGQFYQFALNGSGSTPLSDPYLSLFNSSGSFVAEDDDSGPGANSLLVYQATSTGEYYLEASAFSTETGEYTLSATAIAAPPPASPVASISGSAVVAGTPFIDVYFAGAGETFLDAGVTRTAIAFSAAQRANFSQVFYDISSFTNLTFRTVTDAAQADFKLHMADLNDPQLLGFMNFPNGGQQIGAFNSGNTSFSDLGVNKGGLGYITFVHELGHGLGLAHPHDTGGGSTVMTGVTSSGSRGLYDLNQGVFTSMTYNDGWVTSPFGRVSSLGLGYGMQGGFMPLDIAALQQKYGVNNSFNTTNSTYALLDANAVGTLYQSVWDTAGIDTLYYGGTRNANLDLRSATLQDAIGGGGYVSYATGIHGGFVIANNVTIENATGGSGNDTLIGNDAANLLIGNGGNDLFILSGGTDVILGGTGSDAVSFVNWGTGIILDLASASSFVFGATTFSEIEGAIGSNFNDVIFGTVAGDVVGGLAGNDILAGRGGDDTITSGLNTTYDYVYGGAGNDSIIGDSGVLDILLGEAGDDTINGFGGGTNYIYGGTGNNTLSGFASVNVFLSEGFYDRMEGSGLTFYYRYAAGSTYVVGNSGIDQFIGGAALSDDIVVGRDGNDYLYGGSGNDYLVGGNGNDVIIGENGNDTLDGGAGVNLLWSNDVGNDEILVQTILGGTQVLDYFEAGGTNDYVRIIGSTLTSFAQFTALRDSMGTAINNNILYNTGSGAQLYLNLGANQTAIWFQSINAYALTSADFAFGQGTPFPPIAGAGVEGLLV